MVSVTMSAVQASCRKENPTINFGIKKEKLSRVHSNTAYLQYLRILDASIASPGWLHPTRYVFSS